MHKKYPCIHNKRKDKPSTEAKQSTNKEKENHSIRQIHFKTTYSTNCLKDKHVYRALLKTRC